MGGVSVAERNRGLPIRLRDGGTPAEHFDREVRAAMEQFDFSELVAIRHVRSRRLAAQLHARDRHRNFRDTSL